MIKLKDVRRINRANLTVIIWRIVKDMRLSREIADAIISHENEILQGKD